MSKIELKNKEPLVTIYITNYNYSKFIEKSIKSALSQTYKNFELFIIDVGSTDNSKKIIEKFSNNRKVRIIYKKRSGLINTNNVLPFIISPFFSHPPVFSGLSSRMQPVPTVPDPK